MSDKLALAKEKARKRSNRALIVRTLFLLAVCGVAAFFILAVRLYDVQVNNNSHYESLALSAQLRQLTLRASRGTIFDANGKILAMSAATENVFISPFELDRDDQDVQLIASGLSSILGVDRDMILERAGRVYSQYEIIKFQVESDEASQVREFIRTNRLSGIYLEPNSRRYYPNNNLASQIIGFVGTDHIGLDGLEMRYESHLSGVNGRMVRLTNARGRDLRFVDFEDYIDAHDGHDITLTIDSSVQYYVEKHLAQAIEDYDVENGAMCIVMNARTGAILAIANYPNYDPNDFLRISDREMERLSGLEDEGELRAGIYNAQLRQWRNRSLADTYEPGSVFKILTVAMALEEGIATPDSVYECTGSMEILGRQNSNGDPIPLR